MRTSQKFQVGLTEHRDDPGVWVIETVDDDGGVDQVHFRGQEAEARARAYAFVAFGVENLVPHEITYLNQPPQRRRDRLRLVVSDQKGGA